MASSEQHILVTGGAGFIGTHCSLQLLQGGYKVSMIDNFHNSVMEAVDSVKELAGPKLAEKLQFHKVSDLSLSKFDGLCKNGLILMVLFNCRPILGRLMNWRRFFLRISMFNLMILNLVDFVLWACLCQCID